jgi:hypothetical protein
MANECECLCSSIQNKASQYESQSIRQQPDLKKDTKKLAPTREEKKGQSQPYQVTNTSG